MKINLRIVRQVGTVLLVGLLLAFSATACKGGPTEPSDAEVVALYTGRWRGNINGLQVVLDMGAAKQPGLLSLDGTGTALNPTTGEMHRLKISGIKAGAGVPLFNLFTERVIGPDGRIVGGDQHTGQFRGEVSGDGRTWPGRFTTTNDNFGVPIFGQGEHAVTLTKE